MPQEVTGFDPRTVTLADGSEISSRADDYAWRKLDMPGIESLTGAGVYYGAAQSEAIVRRCLYCRANSAGQAAMYFSVRRRR